MVQSVWTEQARQYAIDNHGKKSSGALVIELAERGVTVSRNAVIGIWHRAKLPKISKKRDPEYVSKKRGENSTAIYRQIADRVVSGAKRRRQQTLTPQPFVCREAPDIEPRRLTISQLQASECRWPYDRLPEEEGHESFRFCGHPVDAGSYCASHLRVSIKPRDASREKYTVRAAQWRAA